MQRKKRKVGIGDYGEQVLSFISEPSCERQEWSREVARRILRTPSDEVKCLTRHSQPLRSS